MLYARLDANNQGGNQGLSDPYQSMARIILHSTRVLAHVKNPHPKEKQCPCACGLHSSLPPRYTLISCITHGTFFLLHISKHLLIALESNAHVQLGSLIRCIGY